MRLITVFLILVVPSIGGAQSKENNNKGKEDFVTLKIPVNNEESKLKSSQRLEAATDYLMNIRDPLPAKLARKMIDKRMNDEAIINEINKPSKFISSVVYTNLQPGSDSIKLNLSLGLPVTIVFKDVKGNPVNIYSFNTPKEHFVAYKPGYSTESSSANGNESNGASGIPNNLLIVKAILKKGGANMPVFATVSEFPLSFDVTINAVPESEYIDRLVVVVDDGKNDEADTTENELKSRDELMRVVNNLPPNDSAESIRFNKGVKAWKSGDYLWIRTKLRLFYPIHLPENVAKSYGVSVYKIKYSPVISLMNKEGNIVRLKRRDS